MRNGSNCLHACHPKLWEWHIRLVDTQDMDCIRAVPQGESLGTPTTEQTRVNKGQQEAAGTHVQELILLSLLPHSLPISICLYLIFIFK